MTEKDISNWIMYHQIHQMARDGFSKARIARFLVIDPRTVGKYLAMSEHDYEQFLIKQGSRNKILTPYEDFVTGKLVKYPDTSAAQMHDWLKEHYTQFPQVSVRTVYNFVMFVRSENNIPVAEAQPIISRSKNLPGANRHRSTSDSTTCAPAAVAAKKSTLWPLCFREAV